MTRVHTPSPKGWVSRRPLRAGELLELVREGLRVEQMELVQDPAVADAKVLEHLRNLGCDTRQARGIRHFIYLPTSDDADAVARVLEREGWDTSVEEDAEVWL